MTRRSLLKFTVPLALLKSTFAIYAFLLTSPAAAAPNDVRRPPITGIAGVQIGTTNMKDASKFFSSFATQAGVPANSSAWKDPQIFTCGSQTISLSATPGDSGSNLLQFIAFQTQDLKQMAAYLKDKHFSFTEEATVPYESTLKLQDPEGHEVRFVAMSKPSNAPAKTPFALPGSCRLIHAGWVTKDRAAMNKFYGDLLGFRVYWHGGMKDSDTDWYDMQVPEGTDWLEYMLNVNPKADKKELGEMNHISLGVPDIKQAANQLAARGVILPEQPEIGRDGKWQLDVYDPDFTRVELMEFTPVEKPCCSEYTGPHPKP